MEAIPKIIQCLRQLPPITLEEMSSIRLMKRTDTKFVTNQPTLIELLKKTQGSYFVQEISGNRVANYMTTYWDGKEAHEMFRVHHCGHRPRTKVRVRTYMDSGISFLEVKKKNNHGKTSKKRISVPSLEAVIEHHFGEDFLQKLTAYTFDDIIPTITNSFKRITLVNFEKTERLTIDFDLHFQNRETSVGRKIENVVIIELKRDGRVPSPILPILRELRVKPSGFSKYCIGTSVTNTHLRQNRFKEKLVHIKKVTGCQL